MRLGTLPILPLLLAACDSVDSDGRVLSDHEVSVHKKCYGYSYGAFELSQDYDLALRWCTASAELGIIHGQTLLAELYQHGRGVDPNLELAASWYRRAAEGGHPHAQLMLGLFHLEGLGVERNQELGLSWLGESAAQGDAEAQRILDELRSRGIE